MMIDPHNPRECIPTEGSFSRIADLLARYLHSKAQLDGRTGENIEMEETDAKALKVGTDRIWVPT